ncbi:MucB/RseB C-terminal domain-containing protein [Chitinasiproducens palmae]|uniref:Sigma E regulatory protein, MucB/RseB n=1 Tax=Chitinasiproducens palmae TaxID=1770053 RepID=A0A1H2PWQ0_9BURK|nr:MucB/RseB C-terminal domain-containing protein [Chitinasiproducens palmae]SDV50987.1 sigma E regulatory protein, MucB/RseB [Chitinasiproducens palmae]
MTPSRRFIPTLVARRRALHVARRLLRASHAALPALLGAALVASAGLSTQALARHGAPSAPPALLSSAPADGASPQQQARWLQRIADAATRLDYEGTFVNQREGTVQSFRITHAAGPGDDGYLQVDALDGTPRTTLTHLGRRLTFLPGRKTLMIAAQQDAAVFPSLFKPTGVDALLDVYSVRPLGTHRVAGRSCELTELRPKDALRFTYRFCADSATGLLLSAQTVDRQDVVLEQVAFTGLRIGGLGETERLALERRYNERNGWQVIDVPTVAALGPAVNAAGSAAAGDARRLNCDVPGFRKLGEWRQAMAARAPGQAPVSVVQAVFGDGVTGVSVFLEPVGTSNRQARQVRSGATNLIAEQHGEQWVTVVGEAPIETLQRFASSLEYKAAK